MSVPTSVPASHEVTTATAEGLAAPRPELGSAVPVVPRVTDQPVAPEGLSYESTVPRALVHRSSVSEVFVTDSRQTGEDSFAVAAQLPRGHLIGEGPLYDFTLLLEVVRQAGVLAAHRHLDVPLASAFILSDLSLRTMGFGPLRIGARPANVAVTLDARPKRNRAGRVQGFSFTGDIHVDGEPALIGQGGLLIVSKAAYRVLRSKRLVPDHPGWLLPRFTAAAPAAVGRRDERNVFITDPVSESDHREFFAQLVVDTSHPHMFDHPLDHVPGHLQVEAARQLAIASVARLHGLDPYSLAIASITTSFTDYTELDQITRLRATVDGLQWDEQLGIFTVPVAVEALQEGRTTTALRLEVAQWR
ncbi:ScbA/BarX family gamma-butyrolactone biosynthesis protein [Streptomyces clavuligerus]|uniref:Gamma-butyrolactone biosynthesis protein n=1 Tax=Streptomyces clavuligerus TaxID=1901 RepID=E2Q9C7_STRCL|nr:ScbA/BarX family gamma-butyrolactone biosynthesis protein [Streptomyces clavuligerus]ANW21328.1 secondary metabolite corepressor [Streptomyces clavuligerus]AXU15954.1 secondary metabolite corepressor [Streptomyces clavuligerus]EFG05547.1 gamma-butyrolactone biosynthesis protein [Streptomyces clavuligerus]MBY6306084.1 secondary metabolite corepressor [Streptomyces clavuligerus]QCS08734.1 secondary metabolite corepressor [Streptomyces clavuligerus]